METIVYEPYMGTRSEQWQATKVQYCIVHKKHTVAEGLGSYELSDFNPWQRSKRYPYVNVMFTSSAEIGKDRAYDQPILQRYLSDDYVLVCIPSDVQDHTFCLEKLYIDAILLAREQNKKL